MQIKKKIFSLFTLCNPLTSERTQLPVGCCRFLVPLLPHDGDTAANCCHPLRVDDGDLRGLWQKQRQQPIVLLLWHCVRPCNWADHFSLSPFWGWTSLRFFFFGRDSSRAKREFCGVCKKWMMNMLIFLLTPRSFTFDLDWVCLPILREQGARANVIDRVTTPDNISAEAHMSSVFGGNRRRFFHLFLLLLVNLCVCSGVKVGRRNCHKMVR